MGPLLLHHLSQAPVVIRLILPRPLAPRNHFKLTGCAHVPRGLLCQPRAPLVPTIASGQALSLLTCLCLPGSQSVSCVFLRQQRPKGTRDLPQTHTLGLNQNTTKEGYERSPSLRTKQQNRGISWVPHTLMSSIGEAALPLGFL